MPGANERLPAVEEAISAGIPTNVTLLFSRERSPMTAEAFLRGIERRIDAGLNPNIGSVAWEFISRWDAAIMGKATDNLHQLGIAIEERTYNAYSSLLFSPRWQRVYNFGDRPQRLLCQAVGRPDGCNRVQEHRPSEAELSVRSLQ
jgi:transaldolase